MLSALSLIASLAHALQAPFAVAEQRHYERQGGYSFVPPVGWAVTDFPGLKYSVAAGPRMHGFTPNIVFVDETMPGNRLEDVAANSLAFLRQNFKNFVELEQGALHPAAARGIRVVFEADQQGMRIRSVSYLFESPSGRRLTATCNAPAAQSQDVVPLCDSSMGTFKWEQSP